jgi:hypothetical protein
MITLAGAWSVGAQVPIDRDPAREAAERELSKGIYHADDPGLIERLLERVGTWLDDRLSDAAGAAPGGSVGLLVLLLLVAGVVALIVWRTGPMRRAAVRPAADFELSSLLDAEEHRRRANQLAAERRYAEAVRERMRAIVRELESRGVLDLRPGRTADEVATEAGQLVPSVAEELRGAAQVFDEVWYGGWPATAATDAAMRQADQRVRSARLVVGSAAGVPSGFQVPR